jgi:hypothetical protein
MFSGFKLHNLPFFGLFTYARNWQYCDPIMTGRASVRICQNTRTCLDYGALHECRRSCRPIQAPQPDVRMISSHKTGTLIEGFILFELVVSVARNDRKRKLTCFNKWWGVLVWCAHSQRLLCYLAEACLDFTSFNFT